MAKKQLLTEPVLPKDSNDSIINPELYHAIKGTIQVEVIFCYSREYDLVFYFP